MSRGRKSLRVKRETGFTLIEIMVTLVIVGILAAIAIPSYQDSVRKGRRAAAQGFLLDVAQREQQYFADSRSFGSLSTLGISVPADVGDYYSVSVAVVAGPPPNFTVTATPIAGGSQVIDGAISIDRNGQRLPADKW